MWVGRTAKAMAAAWIEGIGLLAGIIGIFAWIPQIIQVWVHKRHDGLSLTTFAVVSFALGLWLVYGILVGSFAMIAANIMTLSVLGAVILGVLRVRKSERQTEEIQL
jgi:MtN3 and saliva related transmembrane protein